MKIFEYPKCSTCKAAKKFITSHNIPANFVDITLEQPTKDDILKILATFDVELKKLFNTSGIKYRELQLKDKLPQLSEAEQIDILLSDGLLIKRPLGFDFEKKQLLIGYKEDIWTKTLL